MSGALRSGFQPRSISSQDRDLLMILTAGRPAVIWGSPGAYSWGVYSPGSYIDDEGYSIEVVQGQYPVVAVIWGDQTWYPTSSQGAIELFRTSDYGTGYALGGDYEDIESGEVAYSSGSRWSTESEERTAKTQMEAASRAANQAAREQAAAEAVAAQKSEDLTLALKNIAGLVGGIFIGWRYGKK